MCLHFEKLRAHLFLVYLYSFLFIALCTVCHLDSFSNINKELYCDLKLNTTIKCKICFLLALRSSYFMRFRMHYFFASTGVESSPLFFDTWNLVKRLSYFSEQKFFLTYQTLFSAPPSTNVYSFFVFSRPPHVGRFCKSSTCHISLIRSCKTIFDVTKGKVLRILLLCSFRYQNIF